MPMLFATLGYPGSGKTYFCQRLAEKLNIFHLNTDRMHIEIFPNPKFTHEEQITKFRVMNYVAEELLKRKASVIFDADSAEWRYRKELKAMAERNGADYLLLWFKTPLEVALKRVKSRKGQDERYYRVISQDVVLGHKVAEEIPDPKNENFVIIDGTKSFEEQYKILEDYLSGS